MITKYNDRVWLNEEDSPSTGNVVCYDGDSGEDHIMFVSVSDCNCSVRLHKRKFESVEVFIKKVDLLIKTLTRFSKYLHEKYEY